jgi:hypothetical protein
VGLHLSSKKQRMNTRVIVRTLLTSTTAPPNTSAPPPATPTPPSRASTLAACPARTPLRGSHPHSPRQSHPATQMDVNQTACGECGSEPPRSTKVLVVTGVWPCCLNRGGRESDGASAFEQAVSSRRGTHRFVSDAMELLDHASDQHHGGSSLKDFGTRQCDLAGGENGGVHCEGLGLPGA